MHQVRPVKGTSWRPGAISNAKWTGVRLRDVLIAAGYDEKSIAQHVQFEGYDQDMTGTCYGASIPMSKAISASEDVLLAFQMNGEDIPLDHGYPVRIVAPGVAGARNVKWLKK